MSEPAVQGCPRWSGQLRPEGHPRAHLEDGVLHIANLYAGAVVCWLAGEEGLEPGQHRKIKTHAHGYGLPK